MRSRWWSSARNARRPSHAVLTVLALAACGGGGDSPGAPAGSISLAASVSTVSLTPGQSATPLTLTVTRTGTVNEPVRLQVTGLSSGLTATVSPTSLSGTASTAQLTFTAAATAAVAAGTATVTATSGSRTATTTIQVAVTPAPDLALALDSASLTAPLSTSKAMGVRITRTAITSDVALALSGLPAGVTGTFAPALLPVASTTSTLTLAVGGTVAAGTYPLTITATGGTFVRTQPLSLVVTQSGAIAVKVTPNVQLLFSGWTKPFDVQITRTAPFSGPVTLTLPQPPGVTFALSRSVIPAGETTASFTATAGTVLNTGTPVFAVSATGAGVRTATGDFGVALAPLPTTFAVLTSQDTLPVPAGGSVTTRLDIVRGVGFGATIAFTGFAGGGLTPVFPVTSTAGNSIQVQIAAGAAVAPGLYYVDLLADGGGTQLGFAQLVRVTAPAGLRSGPGAPAR